MKNVGLFGFVTLLGMMTMSVAHAQMMQQDDGREQEAYSSPSSTSNTLGTIKRSEINLPMSSPANYQADTVAAVAPPQSLQAGDIVYITGGIGDEERDAMHAVQNNYNVHILSAQKDGSFIGDTHVTVMNAKGDTALDANMEPLFYAQMKPGKYTFKFSHGDDVKKQTLVVGRKLTKIHVAW